MGEMVQPRTPPTKTDRKIRAAARTDRKEVGQRRKTNLWGWDTPCVQPSDAHMRSWGQPSGSHRGYNRWGLEPPCGQPSGAHRRSWGQPSGAHRGHNILIQKGDTSVRPAVRRPQEKVWTAIRSKLTKGKPPWGQPFGAHRRRCGQPSGAHRK